MRSMQMDLKSGLSSIRMTRDRCSVIDL